VNKLRIMILFDPHGPINGGGYYLIRSVIDGFKLGRTRGKHEYIIVSYGKAKNNEADFNFIPEKLPIRVIKKLIVSKSVKLQSFMQNHSKLARFLNRHNTDLVFFLGVPAQITNIPFVLTVWDLQHRTHPWFPELSREWVWQSRESYFRKFLPRAICVITGTRRGKQEIKDFYGVNDSNIFIIPHIFEYKQKNIKPKNLVNRIGPYLYPAQFWAHKNHYIIVQSVKILRDRYKIYINVNFIGSDKGNQNYIEDLVRTLGLSNQIKFLGFVSDKEKEKLYKSSKGLIYSSFSGPENIPPLEAIAFNLPIIYADFPGAREQLGNIPIYFDPLNVDSLVRALLKLERKSINSRNLTSKQEFLNKKTELEYFSKFNNMIEKVELMLSAWDRKDHSKF